MVLCFLEEALKRMIVEELHSQCWPRHILTRKLHTLLETAAVGSLAAVAVAVVRMHQPVDRRGSQRAWGPEERTH
jgi:hypothetical protein